MIANLEYVTLQHIWWILCSVVGSLFLFLTFVQGGNSLLWQVAKSDTENALVINSLGRKWELTFTTLVLFGGALFAAFPKFYAISFGGAYWVWTLILFTFILQAVSYEFRKKDNNLLGAKTYETFLFINGTVGILLIGAAVGTFFTGSNFTINDYNQVEWTNSLRGLEAAFSLFNLSLGLFLVFNARVLGAMYLLNNINFSAMENFEARLRKAVWVNFLSALPFLLYFLVSLLLMEGLEVDKSAGVSMVANKYLLNLLAMPQLIVLLLIGLLLVIFSVYISTFKKSTKGIWPAGLGTVLVGLVIFFLAGFNNSTFYPSKIDFQASLTITNASSSHYTLMVMTYVALGIPFVLAYVAYVWKQMDAKKLAAHEVSDGEGY